MRIEFDPTNPTEAAAVRAMLTAMAAPETPWIAKRYVANEHLVIQSDTPDGDKVANAVSQAAIDTLQVAPSNAASDPWHQGTTVMTATGDANPPIQGKGFSAVPATDSTGTPWDERIHSTPATTNKDGTWRAKRGVTAEQIAEVKAEQRAQKFDTEMAEGLANDAELGLGTPAPVALADETAEVKAAFEEPVTAPLVEPAVSAPAAPPAPPVPEPSSTPPAPPVNAGTSAPSFLDVMKAITAAQKDGKIDTTKVKELCAAVGAGESTMGLNGPDNGDKRVAFMALLGEVVS